MLPLESVPNVSEGRDRALVDAIGDAYRAGGARVLDTHVDADHGRAVHTLLGGPDDDGGLVDALVAGIAEARAQIDLRSHEGVHPCVGAADVVPLVPLDATDMPRARAAALALGARVGEELGLPVFLYGEVGHGLRPAHFRRGGPSRLQARVDAGEVAPDFGPTRLHPSAGAVLVGARAPLAAFNLVLAEADLETAQRVAAAVRASSGGMEGVQAIGLALPSAGRIQVSMNVIDLDASALHLVVERVEAEAARSGARVAEGELVGLLPARVVLAAAAGEGVRDVDGSGLPGPGGLAAAARALRLPALRADRVIEHHLAAR